MWLTFVLKQFPYTYPWKDQVDDHLVTIESTIGMAILHAIPNLLMLALISRLARSRYTRFGYSSRQCAKGEP